jgi:hypothetical protein
VRKGVEQHLVLVQEKELSNTTTKGVLGSCSDGDPSGLNPNLSVEMKDNLIEEESQCSPMWTSTLAIHPHLHSQISGLITRANARQLNNQVSSFLDSYSSYLDNGNMCSVLCLRNDGQE